MTQKVFEATAQFYNGKYIYPKCLYKTEETTALSSKTMDIVLLLFMAIPVFSSASESLGYRPIRVWEGRMIYLSPMIFMGAKHVIPEVNEDKLMGVLDSYHAISQALFAVAILKISQKKGYHHGIGAVSGFAYMYVSCNHLSKEQKKASDVAISLFYGALYIHQKSLFKDKAFVVIGITLEVNAIIFSDQIAAKFREFIEANDVH